MKEPLFRLIEVSFSYQGHRGKKTLNSLKLEIFGDRCLALIGAVGSGKTTLLKLLVGLLKPLSGEIRFNGALMPVKGKALRELRRKVGMAFQFAETQIFEATVLDEVRFGLNNFDFPAEEIESLAREGLSLVGLPPEKFAPKSPFELSGGERKRLGLASILALNPKLLLLDEPVAGLDSPGRKALVEIINNRRLLGGGSILVTHDLDLAMESCEEVAILKDGDLVYSGGREVFYDFESLRKWKLEPPELALEWQKLIDSGATANKPVYSLKQAEQILLTGN